jgi:acyl-CoA thioester hydrolase
MTEPNETGFVPPTSPLPREGSVRVRVRYAECDPQGVAHHSSYVPWLEAARTELLRGEKAIDPATGDASYTGGVSYADMERAGAFLVVAKLAMQYKAPAVYDEVIEIVARVVGGKRARLDHDYEVWRLKEDGTKLTLLATATTTLACVDRAGRPRALPDWLRADAMRDG